LQAQPLSYQQVAITPDGRRAYVTNARPGTGTVLVIDTISNALVSSPIPVGMGPAGIAITPEGKFAYVANGFSSTVSVIATASDTVVDSIDVGFEPTGVAITPDGKRAYVANGGVRTLGGGTVSVIDTATNTVVGNPIRVGDSPAFIAITPDGKKVYVNNANSNNVSVIDAISQSVKTTIPVGDFPIAIAITPDGRRIYVGDFALHNGSIAVIDTAIDTVVTRVTLPPNSVIEGVAVTPDGTRVYATNNGGVPGMPLEQVFAIDTASNTVVGAPITVGTMPEGIAITPTPTPPTPPPPIDPSAIPTLSEWGLIMLIGFLGMASGYCLEKQRNTSGSTGFLVGRD